MDYSLGTGNRRRRKSGRTSSRASDMLGVANQYMGAFRDMRQVSRLYRDVKTLARRYECGERVPVTIFLRKVGEYYDYVEIRVGPSIFGSDPGIILIPDTLIGHKGCEDLKRRPKYPEFRQGH